MPNIRHSINLTGWQTSAINFIPDAYNSTSFSSSAFNSSNSINNISTIPNRVGAVTNNGLPLVSNDLTSFELKGVRTTGNIWRNVDSGIDGSSIRGLAYGNGFWLAGSYNRNLLQSNFPPLISRSTDGITWVTAIPANPLNFGVSINAIAFGAGRFVAGSSTGLANSTDGITWTTNLAGGLPGVVLQVVYGNNIFVASGQTGRIHSSTDGITWTTRTSNVTTFVWGLGYGNGLWVAGTNSGVVITSTDAVTWTSRTSNAGAGSVHGIAYGNGYYVAVTNGAGLPIVRSTDGITWSQITNPTSIQLKDISYGDGLWVIGGYSGIVLTSTDTTTWTTRQSNLNSRIVRVRYDQNKWVSSSDTGIIVSQNDYVFNNHYNKIFSASNNFYLVSSSPGRNVFVSSDLTNFTETNFSWTTQTSNFGTTNIQSIAYGNGIWVAVGDAGQVRTSTDTITWTTRTSNFGTSRIYSVDYGNGKWLMGGRPSEYLRSSTDGITWVTQKLNLGVTTGIASNFGNLSINSVAYNNGVWVAVGQNGEMRKSTDAITWTTQTSNFGTSSINWIAYGNGTWVAVGDAGQVRTSTDTITWTTRTSNFGTSSISKVAYGNGIWIAGGDAGQVRRSTDTITWTTQTSNIASTLAISSIGYGNGLWLIGSFNVQLRTSPDGITWTTRTSGFTTGSTRRITDIQYAGGRYVMIGNDRTRNSTDGITWADSSGWPADARSLSYGHNTWVSGGAISVGLSSGPLYTSNNNGSTFVDNSSTADFLNQNINCISYGNGVWVIVGSSGNVRLSTNTTATSWIGRDSESSLIAKTIRYKGNRWIIGMNTGTIATSTDSITWVTRVAYPMPSTTGTDIDGINDIGYGNGLWLIGGWQSPGIRTSTDTITWNTPTNPYNTSQVRVMKVAYGNGIWVAAGQSGRPYLSSVYRSPGFVSTSTDTITWTTLPTVFNTASATAVHFGNGEWLMSGTSGQMRHSTNGTTWTSIFSNITNSSYINEIVYGNGTWIIGGISGEIITTQTPGITETINDMSSKNQYAIATASPNIIYYINNQGRWSRVNTGINDNLNYSAVNSLGEYTVVGQKSIYQSTNALTWTTTDLTLLTSSVTNDIVGL